MSDLVLPDARLEHPGLYYPGRKPTVPVRIDPSHPNAGADYEWLFNEGAGGRIRSLAKPLELTATSPVWTRDRKGVAAKFASTDANKYTATAAPIVTSDGAGTGNFTIFVAGHFVREAAVSVIVVQRRTSSPFNFAYLSLNANISSGSQVAEAGMALFWTNALGGESAITQAEGLPASGWYCFAAVRWSSGLMQLYRDGVKIKEATWTLRDVLNTPQTFAIGGNAGLTNNPANTSLHLVRLFNRALTAAQIRAISRHPYAHLVPA